MTTKPFRPMLAEEAELDKLRFPCLISSKFDGWRLCWREGKLITRSGKPVRNDYVRERLSHILRNVSSLDGEVIVGRPTGEGVFRRTESAVSRKEGEPDFTYYVFDTIEDAPFKQRHQHYMTICNQLNHPRVKAVAQVPCSGIAHVSPIELSYLKAGYEGIMFRDPKAPYKQGRSTVREGYLLKKKPFKDAEAMVIGYYPKMHNANEAKLDERGYTKRSSHKANKEELDTLGKLLVVSDLFEEPFCIGTGFNDLQRKVIWEDQDVLLGQLAKFKYQDYGVKDAPRSPVFLGFRSEEDL